MKSGGMLPLKRPRHALYYLATILGLPVILFGIAGSWVNEHLEPLYGKLQRWCYPEHYAPRKKA